MDGYLNFYAVVPSPFKNQLLCRKRFHNELEQIRARNPYADNDDSDDGTPSSHYQA